MIVLTKMPTGVWKRKKGINRRPLSEETKRKIGDKNRGRKVIYNSEKTRLKVLANLTGVNGNPPWNKGTKGIIVAWNKGKKTGFAPWLGKKRPPFSEEWKKKISDAHKKSGLLPPVIKGEKHYRWKGGISKEGDTIRQSIEGRSWRKSVFERDNYTCQECGQIGGELNADHIKPFAYFPDLRFDINNGRTLCVSCHRKTNTYGNKYWKEYAQSIT